jgi:hypothetical protein
LAKHHVFVVQPLTLIAGDEELTAVGVGAGIGHGKQTGFGVAMEEVFIYSVCRAAVRLT